MSDGPHRSLPMRRAWKELAKRGDQSTYDSHQVAEAATAALESDFKNEVSWSLINALKLIFAGLDNSLMIPEIALQQLSDLRPQAAGSVFGMNAVAWSIQLVNEGSFEERTVYQAIGLAAKARAYANCRSIEEHVLRETNVHRAQGVAARLNSAIAGLSETSLGTILANRPLTITRRRKKFSSLDEGVAL